MTPAEVCEAWKAASRWAADTGDESARNRLVAEAEGNPELERLMWTVGP